VNKSRRAGISAAKSTAPELVLLVPAYEFALVSAAGTHCIQRDANLPAKLHVGAKKVCAKLTKLDKLTVLK
jgi:hypothetical protein